MAKSKKITNFKYPKDIDEELVPLLDVIGSIPGLRPLFSCCGHRYTEFYLVLGCSSIFLLKEILKLLDIKHQDISRIAQEGGWIKSRRNQFKIMVTLPRLNPDFALTCYEYGICIYSLKIGLLTKKERKIKIKALKDKFLEFVPLEHW